MSRVDRMSLSLVDGRVARHGCRGPLYRAGDTLAAREKRRRMSSKTFDAYWARAVAPHLPGGKQDV